MQQHQIEVDGTTITVSSYAYQSLLLLTQVSELSQNPLPNSYDELNKMLMQVAHLLQKESKYIEEEQERIREEAVPKPRNAEEWMETQARQDFIAQDLQHCKHSNELISLFNRAFRSGDSVACYLIHRNSTKWIEHHMNYDDLTGYMDYLNCLKEYYPSYRIACGAVDEQDNIQNYITDQILKPLAHQVLNEKDRMSVISQLMGLAKDLFIERVATVLKLDKTKIDVNARLASALGDIGMRECIAIAEEVWSIELIPSPIDPFYYSQSTKTFLTLNDIVNAAEAKHKAKYEC